jgi:glycosyltransferase involved in cell wall biosynthesis
VSLEQIDRELAAARDPVWPGDYLLFLGRLHPVKGIEALLDAFTGARAPRDTQLLIAGPGLEDSYGRFLARRVADDRAVRGRVHFIGAVHGATKWSLLSRARAVCIASHTEGMSLTSLEALATGSPVLTTPEAGPPEVAKHGGLVCAHGVASLRKGIAEVLQWSDAEIADRRVASRQLAEDKFSWRVVGPRYLELYRSLSG